MDLHDGLPARFWDDYIEVCHRHGVPDASVRWYLIRVERYLKAQSSPIEQHAPEHVSTYLTEAGRAAQRLGVSVRTGAASICGYARGTGGVSQAPQTAERPDPRRSKSDSDGDP